MGQGGGRVGQLGGVGDVVDCDVRVVIAGVVVVLLSDDAVKYVHQRSTQIHGGACELKET